MVPLKGIKSTENSCDIHIKYKTSNGIQVQDYRQFDVKHNSLGGEVTGMGGEFSGLSSFFDLGDAGL
jgi:hypothetical protein